MHIGRYDATGKDDRRNGTTQLEEYDKPAELGTWLHPAEITGLTPTDKETKYEIEVLSGMILEKTQHKLGPKSSNNQEEQLAILKSVQTIEELTPTGNQLEIFFVLSGIGCFG